MAEATTRRRAPKKATAETKKAVQEASTKRTDQVYKCGNIGRVDDLRITPGGKSVISFSIAVNKKINQGQPNESVLTDWYEVTAWEGLAENIAASLTKGVRVMVWGIPSIEEYEANDGTTKKQKKINAWNVGIELSFATASVSKVVRNSDRYSDQDSDF